MTQAFISYSHKDIPFAARLADALEALGVHPWIDRHGIQAGDRWSTSIQEGLDTCEVLIVILSPESMASSNVEDEWQYFIDQGKPLLPVLLRPAKIHFQLSRKQYVDFHGQAFEPALDQLVQAFLQQGLPVPGADGDPATVVKTRPPAESLATPPTGTVTFLFADVEGSTERWERHPSTMQDALARHDALMRDVITRHDGYVFKMAGDGLCSAFPSSGQALAAAAEAQRALHEEPWSVFGEDFAPLTVRIGMHTGESEERDGDYFGQPVNRCARIEAAANGGQVLISRAAFQLVRESLPEGVTLRDLGEHRLKDLRFSEHIYQLIIDGLPDITTALRTAEALHPRDRIVVADAADLRMGGAGAIDEGSPDALPAEIEGSESQLIQRLKAAITSDAADAAPLEMTAEEAAELARHKPANITEHRLGRVAEWSQPRYRLDGRFVGLTLLIDQGEDAVSGRWAAADGRFDDLGSLLEAQEQPLAVVLGAPGAGKSTLLRRLELDTAISALRGEGSDLVTFFVSLSTYAPESPGAPLPAPGAWLSERWAARNPDLPPLDTLLAEGRMLLLLDALNEIPAGGEAAYREQVGLWKTWLQRVIADSPGNRIVFSCRGLDYSQPLSTPNLRVPQVRIEALSDEQVRDFLKAYSPLRWYEIWNVLEGQPQLEIMRSPYFLKLLVDQVDASGEIPAGRAALFTGFVRQSLRREVERGNPLFEPGELISSRDMRRITRWKWKTPWDLPDRGVLMTKLAALAHGMQDDRVEGERAQVRVDIDDALDMLDNPHDETILAAGASLAVLDEDEAAEELMYVHQLVQEYFAARQLASEPDPERVRQPWKAAEISPNVPEVIAELDPADPLPPLPSTGWEETTMLATAMAEDPAEFVGNLIEANLALAARCAVQVDVRERLPGELLDTIRAALVERSRDPAADLRDRIACGTVLGELGDPRFENRFSEECAYILPPMVEIPGGTYPIGDDEPYEVFGMSIDTHMPKHEVEIAPFAIGKFAVTNAEWKCFMAAGGYDDERWWDTEDAKAWRRGETTAEGMRASVRFFRDRYRAEPEELKAIHGSGVYDDEDLERWQNRIAMTEQAFETHLEELYPGGRITAPQQWGDVAYSSPGQPVVGVTWYEARAYCLWLSQQTGQEIRLPSEVEWEAAARGISDRRHPWGDSLEPMRCNMIAAHIMGPSQIGIFVEGDAATGLADGAGNSADWTLSAGGRTPADNGLSYPYDVADGRESSDASNFAYRVVRGGGWYDTEVTTRTSIRDVNHVTRVAGSLGFRLCRSA